MLKQFSLVILLNTSFIQGAASSQSWAQIVAEPKEATEVTFGRAMESLQQHDLQQAQELFEKVVSRNDSPFNHPARYHLAQMHLHLKETLSEDDAKNLEKILTPIALQADNNGIPNHESLPIQVETNSMLGFAFNKAGKPIQALSYYFYAIATAYNQEEAYIPPIALDAFLDLIVDNTQHKQFVNRMLERNIYTPKEIHDFWDYMLSLGDYYNIKHATKMLGQNQLNEKKYAQAVELFAKINDTPNILHAQRMRFKTTNGPEKNDAAYALSQLETQTSIADFYLSFAAKHKHPEALAQLKEKVQDAKQQNKHHYAANLVLKSHQKNEAKQLWLDMYNQSDISEKEKYEAAFQLSLLEENEARADVYLITAAGKGNKKACEHAFNKGMNLRDKESQRARRFISAAANSGYALAQREIGLSFKKKNNFAGAEEMFKAARKTDDNAKIEYALMPLQREEAIKRLTPLAQNNKFSLQNEAQFHLALAQSRDAQELALNTDARLRKLAQTKKERAITLYRDSFNKGYIPSGVNLSACLNQELKKLRSQKNSSQHKIQQLSQEIKLILDSIITQDPANIRARLNITRFYLDLNEIDKAIDSIVHAFELDPYNEKTINGISYLCGELTKREAQEAIDELFKELTLIDPENPHILNSLAIHHLQKEAGVEQGVKLLEQAAHYGSVCAYQNLSKLYQEGTLLPQDKERAANFHKQALAIDPENISSLTVLESYYRDQGDDLGAFEYTEKLSKTLDAHGLYQLALDHFNGYAGYYSVETAQKTFGFAKQQYSTSGNLKMRAAAEDMQKICGCNNAFHTTDFNSLSEKEYISVFRTTRTELQKIIDTFRHDAELSYIPHYARLILAKYHYYLGSRYSDQNKRKATIEQAINMLKEVPKETIIALYQYATTLLEEYLKPKLKELTNIPFNELDQDTQTVAQTIKETYESLIRIAEDREPHNFFLERTYNNLGIIVQRIFKDSTYADTLFNKGIEKQESVSCTLSLGTLLSETITDQPQSIERIYSLTQKALKKAEKEKQTELIEHAKNMLLNLDEIKASFETEASSSAACSSAICPTEKQ